MSYRDEAEGALLYDDMGISTVERTDEKMIVKIYIEKHQNWLQVADELWCAVRVLKSWLNDLSRKQGMKHFADLPETERNQEWEQHREESYKNYYEKGIDDFLYVYFYDTYNWVLYENEELYMFLYEMPIQNDNEFVYKHQVENFAYWLDDDVAMMLHFLKSWYHRVNGYPETDEE